MSEYSIRRSYKIENGDPYFRRRTEKGWTLDFVFNRQGLDWSQGRIFYYIILEL